MLTEDQVVDAVANHLRQAGWSIVSTARAVEHGDDIVACLGRRFLVVEAKGEGSSKPGSRRYGQPFNAKQVHTHVSMAVTRCLAVVSSDPTREAALALPDSDQHRRRVQAVKPALDRVGIGVFWVNDVCEARLDAPWAL